MSRRAWVAVLVGWVLAFGIFYAGRGVLSLEAFTGGGNGIPDEAFRWAPGVQRVLIVGVLLFSGMVTVFTAVAWMILRMVGRK